MTALNAAGYVLDAGDGELIWFSGTLMSVKAGSEPTRDGFLRGSCGSPAANGPGQLDRVIS